MPSAAHFTAHRTGDDSVDFRGQCMKLLLRPRLMVVVMVVVVVVMVVVVVVEMDSSLGARW